MVLRFRALALVPVTLAQRTLLASAMPSRRTAMEWLWVALALVVGVAAAAWLAQDRMIFLPQPGAATARLPARAAPLMITAADGSRLHGWIVRGTAVPAPTVLYFGGNAEEVSWTLADARWPPAWTIVSVNYRGYGTSEGKPGELELKADAEALFDAVVAMEGIDPTRVVVFGRSLGSGVATHLAASRPVAGVVLVSPYDSLVAVGARHYPWLPVSLLLRHRFDAATEAAKCRMPLLAIVGTDDTIIPIARSQAFYDAWAGPKTWYAVRNGDHNTLAATPEFWDEVAGFLRARHSDPS